MLGLNVEVYEALTLKELNKNRPNKEAAIQLFSSMFLEVHYYLEKNKEKIYQAFQNLITKSQSGNI